MSADEGSLSPNAGRPELHQVWVVPTEHACDVHMNGGPATLAKVLAGLPISLCEKCFADFENNRDGKGKN